MNLTDFYNFEPLNIVKAKMGIARDTYGSLVVAVSPHRLDEAELRNLTSSSGIEIEPKDLRILSDGTLAYKDSRVLLYIRDVTIYEPRFHLANCITLQQMRAQHRFNRYVVSTNTTGQFKINIIDGNKPRPEIRKLSVCQNCLTFLEFSGFNKELKKQEKIKIVSDFTIENFFKKYSQSLHTIMPRYTEDNAPDNVYPTDFDRVSTEYRASIGWKCEKCMTNLSDPIKRKWLHVHHIDGLKSNNHRSNLSAICIRCHAEEPAHEHMKLLPDYREYLSIL